MRPVKPKKTFPIKYILIYIVILTICIIGIAIALSKTHYFKEENVGRALGIINEDSEKEDEYNELKANFSTIFTNQLEIFQTENINTKKINDKYDFVVTAYNYQKDEENSKINVSIPFINVESKWAREVNRKISEEYKVKALNLMNQISSMNIIYSVEYKAYIQDNIISLAIRSEYKEGAKSQKVELKTFNYNLAQNREATLDEILSIKNITKEDATNRIRNEVKKIQEQNQLLINEGYQFYKREYNSEKYDMSNAKYFVYGKDKMLYILYPYGNEEDTTEMDVIIF